MALNLEKQLLFYGSYHHNPTNIRIHVACVPVLLLTAFLLGTNSPPLVQLPTGLAITTLPLNVGTIASILYSSIYMLMEPVAGGLLAPLLIGWAAYASHLTSVYSPMINYWAAALHIVSWLAQFVGHGIFEGRAPALLDNLVQAFVLAPFFVWFEMLFYLGYRPELKSRMDKAVEREVHKYRKSKEAQKAQGNHESLHVRAT